MVARQEIQEFSDRLVEEFRPRRVVLFGSHAHGRPRQDSDVDLLVVMPFRGNSVRKAMEIVRKLRPRFAVDLVVRSPQQFRRRVDQNDFFLKDVVRKGRVLYEAADT